jgi:hypothetical protein
MDAVLCLREATHFQSMELERPEAICGLESGTRSRLWSTRGDCACRQDVAFFGLRLVGAEIACLNEFSSVFSWLQICRHRRDHDSNVCVVLTTEFQTRCSQSCGPDSRAARWTLAPRSSSAGISDARRCGCCKGSLPACWARTPGSFVASFAISRIARTPVAAHSDASVVPASINGGLFAYSDVTIGTEERSFTTVPLCRKPLTHPPLRYAAWTLANSHSFGTD